MDFEVIQEGDFKYIEQGEGEVLILLHGLFGALSNFTEVMTHFAKKYRVVVPVLPIFELPIRETNLESLTNQVEAFIEYKGYKNIFLFGNSLGGHLALLYTLRRLDNVKALILAGSSGLYEQSFGDTFPQRKNYEFIRQKTAFTFFDPKTATKELVDEVFQTVNDKERAIRVVMMAKSAIRQNMSDELAKITVPTLLIWGKQDKITPPFVAEEFQQKLPDAQLFFIDQCGHAPMMEQPKEFNALLDTFLAKIT